jgi:hypothetical protein
MIFTFSIDDNKKEIDTAMVAYYLRIAANEIEACINLRSAAISGKVCDENNKKNGHWIIEEGNEGDCK